MAHTGLIDEGELGAFKCAPSNCTARRLGLIPRPACQAESKWTQVYSNCRVERIEVGGKCTMGNLK